jgi:hypothetical protein
MDSVGREQGTIMNWTDPEVDRESWWEDSAEALMVVTSVEPMSARLVNDAVATVESALDVILRPGVLRIKTPTFDVNCPGDGFSGIISVWNHVTIRVAVAVVGAVFTEVKLEDFCWLEA